MSQHRPEIKDLKPLLASYLANEPMQSEDINTLLTHLCGALVIQARVLAMSRLFRRPVSAEEMLEIRDLIGEENTKQLKRLEEEGRIASQYH